MVSLKNSFADRFGKAYAVINCLSPLGMAILPVVMSLLKRYYGIQGAVFIFGAILWNTVTIGFLVGSAFTCRDQQYSDESTTSQVRETQSTRARHHGIFDVFKAHPAFVFLLLVGTLEELHYVAWSMYLIPYCEASGVPSHVAVMLSTISGIFGIIGKVAAFITVTYLNRRILEYLLVISSLLVAGSYSILLTTQTFLVFAFITSISGFCVGLQVTLITSNLDNTVCNSHFNMSLSWMLSLRSLSTLFGAVVSGKN